MVICVLPSGPIPRCYMVISIVFFVFLILGVLLHLVLRFHFLNVWLPSFLGAVKWGLNSVYFFTPPNSLIFLALRWSTVVRFSIPWGIASGGVNSPPNSSICWRFSWVCPLCRHSLPWWLERFGGVVCFACCSTRDQSAPVSVICLLFCQWRSSYWPSTPWWFEFWGAISCLVAPGFTTCFSILVFVVA